MKSQKYISELVPQQMPALGNTPVYDIPIKADLNRITMSLTGSVTLSTGATGLLGDGICELIPVVDLVADGTNHRVQIPFAEIVNGNMFRRRKQQALAVTQPGVTIAAQPFAAAGVIDLSSFGALRPKDTSLSETDFGLLQLRPTISPNFNGVFYGGGFAVSASNLTLSIVAHETVELPDNKGQISVPKLSPLFSYQEVTLAGAAAKQRLRLTPDQFLRGLSIRCLNATGLPSDSILSAVRVLIGANQPVNVSAVGLKSACNNDTISQNGVGYYFIDFANEGATPDRLNNMLDITQASIRNLGIWLEFDTLAAGTIRLTQYGQQDRAIMLASRVGGSN